MALLTRRACLQALLVQTVRSAAAEPVAVQHRTPAALAPAAVTQNWAAFLGPSHNATSLETPLRRELPPPLVWELRKGSGYTSPAIVGERLFFLHRLGDEEVVECLQAETGSRRWRFGYPTSYRDRFGYNDGPRASPVVDGGRVFALGAEGRLHCLDIETGEAIWSRNLRAEYEIPQGFFGASSTPLVEGEVVVVNVGGPRGACVVGFDRASGREVWRTGRWGPSYASPIPATIHGRRRVFVFAGGESRPPTGGLLSIDPADGTLDFAVPHRSRSYESVNASCPVVIGNRVFVSASYRTGGLLVEVQPDFTHRTVWASPDFALHFNTAVHRDGYLYGFDGRNQGDASLVCLEAASGRVVWREVPSWTETLTQRGRTQRITVGTARGSLLAADGQFLCLGEFGHLLWMDLTPQGYTEVSRAWLFAARESWTLPVLSRGLLYVTQNTLDPAAGDPPRLLCYDLRGR